MNIIIVYQLALAVFLGALIGSEREYKRKRAGFQTYSLVTLGSCLFTIIASEMVDFFFGRTGMAFDPVRVIQAIVLGISFIGAGAIFRHSSGITGLTTATGLWVAAGIGMTIGIELYCLATFVTFLVLVILFGFGWLETKIFK